MPCILSQASRVFAPLFAVLAISASSCWADCGPGCCIIDGHTRYMWARTWNAQDALASPLNPYFIPRTPANCNPYSCYSAGCQSRSVTGTPNQYGAYPYPASAGYGFEPTQFERLGKVPNELDLVGAPQPVGAPLPKR